MVTEFINPPQISISIVIVNSNGGEITMDCLRSLFANPPRISFEVILVDNSSEDGVCDLVSRDFPQVRLIRSNLKQGFSKNYNCGIALASGNYVFVVNNDTLFHPDFFDEMISSMERHKWSMAGPKLLTPSGHIQYGTIMPRASMLSYAMLSLFFGENAIFGWPFSRIYSYAMKYCPERSVPAISGACMGFDRDGLERGGVFSEDFEFYFEDVELCHRYRARGLTIGYVPRAHITHIGNASLGKVKFKSRTAEYMSARRFFRDSCGMGSRGAYFLWALTLVVNVQRLLALWLLSLIRSEKFGPAYREYARLIKWIWAERRAILPL